MVRLSARLPELEILEGGIGFKDIEKAADW